MLIVDSRKRLWILVHSQMDAKVFKGCPILPCCTSCSSSISFEMIMPQLIGARMERSANIASIIHDSKAEDVEAPTPTYMSTPLILYIPPSHVNSCLSYFFHKAGKQMKMAMAVSKPYSGAEFGSREPTPAVKTSLFIFFVFIRAIHPTAPCRGK